MRKTITLLCIFSFSILQAQECLLHYIPLDEKIATADAILLGKVVEQEAFLDEIGAIQTKHELEIYTLYKGSISTNFISVTTRGGLLGDKMTVVRPEAKLVLGEMVVLFLEQEGNTFRPLSMAHGLGVVHENEVKLPFMDLFSLDLLKQIIASQLTSTSKELKSYQYKSASNKNAAISISSFSPTTVTAGTEMKLTINGSGFGATRGSGAVMFKNADNGGSTFMTPVAGYYISWSDTKIEIEVPSTDEFGSPAGNGVIKVRNNNAEEVQSAQSLTISFARSNLNNGGDPLATHLVNSDGSGGYLFEFQTDFFDNQGAMDAFERALNKWRCNTYINFEPGNSTTNDAAYTAGADGDHVIRFDNGGELPGGVLGITVSRYTGCTEFNLDEIDMSFNDGTNWNYSTNAPNMSQYDFETVALHELGHAVQLGHVINSSLVMHYSAGAGQQKRTLVQADIDGGLTIVNDPETHCARPSMVKLNNDNCTVGTPSTGGTALADDSTLSSGQNTDIHLTGHIGSIQWQESTDENIFFNINGANSSTYNTGPLLSSTYYRAKVTNGNAPPAYSNIVLVQVGVLGVDLKSKALMEIAYDSELKSLTIKNLEGISKLEIMDLAGRMLISKEPEAFISLSHLEKGIYLIRIEDAQGSTFSKKMILGF